MRGIRTLSVALLATLAAAALACSSSSDGDASLAATFEGATERGPYGVGVTTIELVDTSRETEAHGEFGALQQRTLPTEVWYPTEPSAADEAVDGALDTNGAPYPLIIFAHGFSGNRRQSVVYTQHLASHGYVVASPDFPLTSIGAPGGPYFLGVLNQPGDVSFVIDEMLRKNSEAGDMFEGAIDGEAIGVTGHSMGAFTTLRTIYGEGHEARVDAAISIAGTACFYTEEDVGDIDVPVMLLSASNDLIVAPATSRLAYEIANPPRYWVELVGANHIRFADVDLDDIAAAEVLGQDVDESENPSPADIENALNLREEACTSPPYGNDPPLTLDRQQELLRAFATPFFDGYLKSDSDALAYLQEDLANEVGELRFEYEAE